MLIKSVNSFSFINSIPVSSEISIFSFFISFVSISSSFFTSSFTSFFLFSISSIISLSNCFSICVSSGSCCNCVVCCVVCVIGCFVVSYFVKTSFRKSYLIFSKSLINFNTCFLEINLLDLITLFKFEDLILNCSFNL